MFPKTNQPPWRPPQNTNCRVQKIPHPLQLTWPLKPASRGDEDTDATKMSLPLPEAFAHCRTGQSRTKFAERGWAVGTLCLLFQNIRYRIPNEQTYRIYRIMRE